MSAYRGPKVSAALHLVKRMDETLKGRMTPGGAAHSSYVMAARVAASIDGLEELARTRSPSETPEAHALRVANAAKKLDQNLSQARETFNNNTTQAWAAFADKLAQATKLDRETPHAAEIRAYFRSLKTTEERLERINEAVKSRDSATLSALVNGPDYLSGVDKAMRDKFIADYQREVAPDLVAEIDAFTEADQSAQEVLRIAQKSVREAFDPSYVEKILTDEAKAQETRERLDASISDITSPPPSAAA